MAYLKWQTIAKWGSSGTLALSLLLFGLFNLAGMEVSDDGDKDCTDCFSEIRVNSSFWEIRVEYAGDEPVLFKKRTRSRTLWLNLNKIDELVTTDPKVKTEILVGAISRTADLYNEEYGHLRHLKDGDTLIGRGKTNRIILHGINVSMIVKWTFEMDHWLSEGISIDPVWRGISIKELRECYDESYRESIESTCYRDVTYEDDSKGGKKVSYPNRTVNFIVNESYTCYNVQIKQREVCNQVGFEFNGKKINYERDGFFCKQNGLMFICDSKTDGNADGICQSGESCETINLLNLQKNSKLDFIKGLKIE